MYYALTVKNGIITGVHESEKPITSKTFAQNPTMASDEVVLFESGEYAAGHNVKEYKDGKLRPLVDRIKEKLVNIPAGHELIGDELVKKDIPFEEAPITLKNRILALEARIAALEAKKK